MFCHIGEFLLKLILKLFFTSKTILFINLSLVLIFLFLIKVDLSAAMDMENLQSVIENTGAMSQLAQHLPTAESTSDSTHTSQSTPDNLKDTITSPQFRQVCY